MPRAAANGIEIEYESFGCGEPLLLVMGVGAQMLRWPTRFCEQLAACGYQVIRFDNRDVGLSTKLEQLGVPEVKKLMVRALLGLPVTAPYSLFDMADDLVGLLDALKLPQAHLVGMSMGGMVAQAAVIAHPERFRSLVSVMSSTGNRWASLGRPRALRALLTRPPRCAEDAAWDLLRFHEVCAGSRYVIHRETVRNEAVESYERCHYPAGFARQFAAILATGDRTPALRLVRTPTLVMHGSEDPLMRPVAGEQTARAVPGARLRIFQGLGHAMPEPIWPAFIAEIDAHCRAAGGAPGARFCPEPVAPPTVA